MMLDSSAFFDMEVGKKQPRPELKENEVLKLDEIAPRRPTWGRSSPAMI